MSRASGSFHNPVTDESFYAAKGAGAFLNARRFPCARRRRDCKTRWPAWISANQPSPWRRAGGEAPYYSQRNFGSSALEWCFVAAGRLDVHVHGGQMLWDYAAGMLILSEAGGAASSIDGTLAAGPAVKRGVIAASCPALLRNGMTG